MHAFRFFRRSAISLFLVVAAAAAVAQSGPPPEITPATSRVIERGDLELVTFESEEDVAKLEQLVAAEPAKPLRPGELAMRYFRSATDGSVQPMALWLPANYDPVKKYPLVVQLHGIGPKVAAGRRLEWPGMEFTGWIDRDVPAVIAQAYGRGNTFYQGIGEQDVLEVIAEARRLCSVDDRRIYLMGHSMGGAGAFTVGLRQPHLFGGITAIDAAMGAGGITGSGRDYPDWLKPQTQLFFPDNLFPNARNVPVFLKNAGAGIQKTSTQFTDGIVAEGGFSTTESFPGMPHHFVSRWSYATFLSQLLHKPAVHSPPQVKFVTNTLAYNWAYWVTLDRLVRSNAAAKITATYDDGQPAPLAPSAAARRSRALAAGEPVPDLPTRPGSLTVATDNIAALTLRMAESGVPAGAKFPLKIDGSEIPAPFPPVLHLARIDGAWQRVEAPSLAGKHHGMQGPIGDALNSRFLAVYCDGDRPLAVAELDAIRNPPGRLVIHAEFPMKSAAKLTADDIATSNLLLFGTPETNPVLARLAPRLPAALMQAIAAGTGVIFIHPNPENPGRYVVVWSTGLLSRPTNGLLPIFLLPINQLPDYVLVRDGKVAAGGWFDHDWKLDVLPVLP